MPDEAPTKRDELTASTQRWMTAGLALMGVFFLAFPLYRLYEPDSRAEARVEQRSFLAAQGEELFEGSCASCHGVAGTGAIAPAVGAKEFLESADDTQIAQLVSVGIPGSEMVGYSNDFGGPMTAQEINAITVYLRSLEEDAISKPNWRTPLADEDLTSGELYALACSRCHGQDLAGIEDVAPDISLTSITQMETDDFLSMRIVMGYKAMPRFGGVLTDGQVADIVAFLRGNPDGATPPTTVPSATTVPGDGGTTTTTAPPDTGNEELLALGKRVWDVTAGGSGCQECHGPVAQGTPSGPNVIGASRSSFLSALNGGTEDMDFTLTSEEIEAVYAYMQFLTTEANS